MDSGMAGVPVVLIEMGRAKASRSLAGLAAEGRARVDIESFSDIDYATTTLAELAAADETGAPFQTKVHTGSAILCGDFNLESSEPEYATITAGGLHDAWTLLHGALPQPPTFRVFDRSYGAAPVACDFVFVSAGLLPRLRRMAIDGSTRASDHQPVLVDLS